MPCPPLSGPGVRSRGQAWPSPAGNGWWRAGLAALTALLMLVMLGAAQAQPDGRNTAQATWSNLGAGPASTTLRDPVQTLALDIAEHLPADIGGPDATPLPLHPPWLALDPLLSDDLQGAEWGGLWPARYACEPATHWCTVPEGTRFDSIDPRHHDRPPSPADCLRP